MNKQQILDAVLQQIQTDIKDQDLSAIAELISFLPIEKLTDFLPNQGK